jgi:hypothetical protein
MRLDNERTRNNKARSLGRWAEYAKKAIAKAEALEQKRIDSKKKEDSADAA